MEGNKFTKYLKNVNLWVLLIVLTGLGYIYYRSNDFATKKSLEELNATLAENKEINNDLVSKVSSLESGIGDLQLRLSEAEPDNSNVENSLDVEILSNTTEKLEVIETNDTDQIVGFVEQDVIVLKLKITNNSTNSRQLGNYTIAGKTESGTLINVTDLRSRDRKGQGLTAEIAPGGSVEVYAYLAKRDHNFVGIFVRDTGETIEF